MGNFNQNYKSNQREMHKATCAECGSGCEVPFKPSSNKPIYCSTCFENRSSGGGDSRGQNNRRENRGDNRRDDRNMFKATCAECGSGCEVPFRPTGDKAVYCDSCFSGRNKNNTKRGPGTGGKAISSDQFDILNSKLNAILKVLGPKEEKISTEKIVSKEISTKKDLVKKPTAKKEVKKNPAKKAPVKKAAKKSTVKKVTKKIPAKKTAVKKAAKKNPAKKKK